MSYLHRRKGTREGEGEEDRKEHWERRGQEKRGAGENKRGGEMREVREGREREEKGVVRREGLMPQQLLFLVKISQWYEHFTEWYKQNKNSSGSPLPES